MSPLYVVRRLNLMNHRQEWLVYHTASTTIGWAKSEEEARKFRVRRVACRFRREAREDLSKYHWRVTVREQGAVDVCPKPDLRTLNWKLTNVQLARQYSVSVSTIANWRIRAGRPPAPRGGKRVGAGRRPTK